MFDSIRSAKISSTSLRNVFIWSLVFLGLVYLILISSEIVGPLNPILLTVLLIFFLLTKSKGNLGIEVPALAFMAVLILTSFTSIDPRRSFYEVWLIGIGILLIFVTARIVQRGFSPRMLINFLLVIGLGMMLFSWFDAGRWYLTWKSFSPGEWIPGISFRLNGGNTIAAYYHGILMIGIARLFYSRSRIKQAALGAYCLSAVLLIFLTSSRGAYVAVAGGLGVLVWLQWKTFKAWLLALSELFRRYRVQILGLGLFIFLVFAGIVLLYLQGMQAHPTHGPALQSRNAFWVPAWNAFLRSPWIGNGPYTFASAYMQSVSVPPVPIFLHAHSTYLDILSGSGLVGLLVAGWLAGMLVYQLWRLLRRHHLDHPDLVLGALLALTSFLIHSIFDGLYLMPFAAFNMTILIGAALGERRGDQSRLAFIPASIGLLVGGAAWIIFWMTSPYLKGLQAAENENYQLAAEQFSLSAQRDSHLVLAHQQLGLIESVRALEGNPDIFDRALHSMELAVMLDPAYSANHANLAALYKANGELDQAIEEFKRAIELAPKWTSIYLNLGEVYEMQENWGMSAQAYEEVLSLEPTWGSDGFWAATSFRSEFLTKWLEKNGKNIEDEFQLTEERVTNQPLAAPIIKLAALKIAAGDLQEAERLLGIAQLAFFHNQSQRLELEWLYAELAAANGDWSKAASLGEETLDGLRLQGAYGPGSAGETLYGTGIFRLKVMKVELVPQLTLVYLPEPWPQRMARLGSWYQNAVDFSSCVSTQDNVIHYDGDVHIDVIHPSSAHPGLTLYRTNADQDGCGRYSGF